MYEKSFSSTNVSALKNVLTLVRALEIASIKKTN